MDKPRWMMYSSQPRIAYVVMGLRGIERCFVDSMGWYL